MTHQCERCKRRFKEHQFVHWDHASHTFCFGEVKELKQDHHKQIDEVREAHA